MSAGPHIPDRLDLLLLHSLDIVFAHLYIEIHGVGKICAVYGLFKLSYFHTGIKFFKFFFKAPQAKIDEEKAKQENYRQMMAQVEERLASLS